MTKIEMYTRIREIRDELEQRYRNGSPKLANADGSIPSTAKLQEELYSLIYKLSKAE